MAAATTRLELLKKMAMRGYIMPWTVNSLPQASTATAGSGYFNVVPKPGPFSTLYSDLRSIPVANTPAEAHNLMFSSLFLNLNGGPTIGWLYKIGTLVLTATGDQFTHDAATFPVLRKRMGTADLPINLIPMVMLDVATSVTAPIFTIKNAGATTGYKNQAGATVVGTKTFTFPLAATVLGSCYLPKLEEGDLSIQDIQSINVGTASTTGTAQIWGYEPMMSFVFPTNGIYAGSEDYISSIMQPLDMRPGVATSGTAVARLVCVDIHDRNSSSGAGIYMAGGNA